MGQVGNAQQDVRFKSNHISTLNINGLNQGLNKLCSLAQIQPAACFCKISFMETQSYPLIYVLSLASFCLPWQSQAAATRLDDLQSLKYLLTGPLKKKFTNPWYECPSEKANVVRLDKENQLLIIYKKCTLNIKIPIVESKGIERTLPRKH